MNQPSQSTLSKQDLITKQVKRNFIRPKPVSSLRVISHMLYSGSDGVPVISTCRSLICMERRCQSRCHIPPQFRQLSTSLGCTCEEEKGKCALFTQ